MTSYSLTVGYNSTRNTVECERKLEMIVNQLREHPEKIVAEVLRLEPTLDADLLAEYGEHYRLPERDLTCQVKMEPDEGAQHLVIKQLASGGGQARNYKEAMRRAVARIIIEEMHKERMEVSFAVG